MRCRCDGEVLLLKRTSNHNHGTWGLPGGNADGTDVSLLETARREAVEEMGPNLPPFEVVAEVPTRRGKRCAIACHSNRLHGTIINSAFAAAAAGAKWPSPFVQQTVAVRGAGVRSITRCLLGGCGLRTGLPGCPS